MSEIDETAEAGATGVEVEGEVAEEAVAAVLPAEALEVPAGVAHASVYVCERAHRTFSVWSTPTTCRAHINRREECGRQLYPLGELPEQVQKALNPLKASKKSSKKG